MSSTDKSTAPSQKKREVWHRVSKTTAYTRALQFLGIMESCGEHMWGICCGQIICYKENYTATNHIKSGEHKKHAEQMKKGVTYLGHSTVVRSPQQVESRSGTSSARASQPIVKQIDLISILDGTGANQTIGDDFTAAFLQARVPRVKLQHLAIQCLIRKYIEVRGCFGGKDEIYTSAWRVWKVHKVPFGTKAKTGIARLLCTCGRMSRGTRSARC